MSISRFLAGLVLVGAAVPAISANIVMDPGFETAGGGGTGYVNSPNYAAGGVWQQVLGSGFVLVSAPNAHSGSTSYAPNGFGGNNATVEQQLATMANELYDLSFYYQFDSNGPLTVTFGGLNVAFTSTPDSGGWLLGTATGLMASGASTALAFSSIGGNTALDDVSVTLAEPAAAPEPASLLLAVSGIVGCGLVTSRRRTRRGTASSAMSIVMRNA